MNGQTCARSMRVASRVYARTGAPQQLPAGTILPAESGCWMLVSGAAEQWLAHPTCGNTILRCRPQTLLGGVGLVFADLEVTTCITRDATVVPLDAAAVRAMLADPERGPWLWQQLRMQACPRRSPAARVVHRGDTIEVRSASAAVVVDTAGAFVWSHLNGQHSLEQLARARALAGARPDAGVLLQTIDQLVAAGLADAPRPREAYSPKSKTR